MHPNSSPACLLDELTANFRGDDQAPFLPRLQIAGEQAMLGIPRNRSGLSDLVPGQIPGKKRRAVDNTERSYPVRLFSAFTSCPAPLNQLRMTEYRHRWVSGRQEVGMYRLLLLCRTSVAKFSPTLGRRSFIFALISDYIPCTSGDS
jgi:hypothetical protein